MPGKAIVLASLLTVTACASHAAAPPNAPMAAAAGNRQEASAGAPKVADATRGDESAQKVATGRKLGDFHVYQYGGSFMKHPVTLTEQVIAREGDVVTVDFVLEEGDAMTGLRVHMKSDDEIVSVARITPDGEVPATREDYDALMAKTQVVPDSNDETLATDHTSCIVGEQPVDCDVTTYKVTVGGKQATLTVSTSEKVPGHDLGGQLVSEDGKVLYTARLVEKGNAPPAAESFARIEAAPTSPESR